MQIEIKDGFRFIREKNGMSLLLESDRLQEYMDYALRSGISSLSIQGYHGYKLSNVDFLANYDFFTSISVIKDIETIDIGAVHHLRRLKRMNISNDGQPINFSFFPELSEAGIEWNKKVTNLDKCPQLRSLIIRKYKPDSKTFFE